jgi:hypothetical protein
MARVETEQEMRFLLLEKDMEHRDSLDIITEYVIIAFLESKFADNVVKEIWRSPYSTNDSIFSASTNHFLTFQYWHCVQDEECYNRFYHDKDIRTFEAHPMQFTVWRFSGKSRIIVEFVSTIIIASVVHIVVNLVLKGSPDFNEKMSDFLQVEKAYKNTPHNSVSYQQLEQAYLKLEPLITDTVETFFNKVMAVSYISFLPLFYGIQHLFDIVYASINKRSIDAYSFLGLLDLLIFFIFITNIFVTYAKNLAGTWMDFPMVPNDTRAKVYARNYMESIYVSEDAIWFFCIVIMWVRVFYFLRYNEFMGKFIGIVERLFKEVVLFFIFYIIQLIFFSLIAELCFRRPTDYNTAYKAFKTLFYASLGNFSFDDISQSEKGEYFGITFMIIFLVCNIGIILNIFIAVIAVLYDTYSEKRNIYQMLETLKIRP